jgi:hypothetical protein
MKRLSVILLFTLCAAIGFAQSNHPLIKDCEITQEHGLASTTKSLWGNIKVVTNPKEYAELNVKIVSTPGLADVYVKTVSTPPDQCGEWRFIKSAKDAWFTVRFVDAGEDFTICFVKSEPGCRY